MKSKKEKMTQKDYLKNKNLFLLNDESIINNYNI